MFLRLLLPLFLLISVRAHALSENKNSTQIKNPKKVLKKKKTKRKLTKKKNAALEKLMKKLRILLPELDDEELSTLLEDPKLLLQILNKLVEDKKISLDELKKMEGLLKGALDYDVKKEELAANAKTRGKGESKDSSMQDLMNKYGSKKSGSSGGTQSQGNYNFPPPTTQENNNEEEVKGSELTQNPNTGFNSNNGPGRNQRESSQAQRETPRQSQNSGRTQQNSQNNWNPITYKKSRSVANGGSKQNQHTHKTHDSSVRKYVEIKIDTKGFQEASNKQRSVPVSHGGSSVPRTEGTAQAVVEKSLPKTQLNDMKEKISSKTEDDSFQINWKSTGIHLIDTKPKPQSTEVPSLLSKIKNTVGEKISENVELMSSIYEFKEEIAIKRCDHIPIETYLKWDEDTKNFSNNFKTLFMEGSLHPIFRKVSDLYPKAVEGGEF